jgi:hypothetical protein
LEEQFGAAAVEFHIAEFVEAEQVDAAVAGGDAGQLLVVGGFGELIHQLGREGVADPVAGLGGGDSRADERADPAPYDSGPDEDTEMDNLRE